MQKFDLLIVGAGMVGLTLALAIRKQTSLTVAIADMAPITELGDIPQTRVSAINLASWQLFSHLDVWSDITKQRVQPYQHMHIWDKSGWGKLDFSLDDAAGVIPNGHANEQLGWIVENSVIRNALWKKAQADSGITFFTQEPLQNIAQGESEVFASFAEQMPITAKLIVGADGANSWVRKQLNMSLTFKDYDHHAIVGTVKCEQSHNNTAWQVFLEHGPLALLPLYDSNLCSIVWSTSPEHADELMQATPADFSKALTAASDGKLGNIQLDSELSRFPLTMRMSQNFIKERAVLIGDAAHTIHPLAGQGVNLGLLDASALAQILSVSYEKNNEIWFDEVALKQFNRWRKAHAAEMIGAMEGIKQTFTPQHPLPKFVRGIGLSLLNKAAPLKSIMVKQALGLSGDLPKLSKT